MTHLAPSQRGEQGITWKEEPSTYSGKAILVGTDTATSAKCAYVVDSTGVCELVSEDSDQPPDGESWPRPPASSVASAAKLAATHLGPEQPGVGAATLAEPSKAEGGVVRSREWYLAAVQEAARSGEHVPELRVVFRFGEDAPDIDVDTVTVEWRERTIRRHALPGNYTLAELGEAWPRLRFEALQANRELGLPFRTEGG